MIWRLDGRWSDDGLARYYAIRDGTSPTAEGTKTAIVLGTPRGSIGDGRDVPDPPSEGELHP